MAHQAALLLVVVEMAADQEVLEILVLAEMLERLAVLAAQDQHRLV
jgi:hypothetical protein